MEKEIRNRLDNLFYGLWGNRGGVHGSWGADAHCYHPTYIHRGALLIVGQTEFSQLYVLSPPDCKVIPEYGNSCANCSTFPHVEGKAIRVLESEEGPWWEMLAVELPKMEKELEDSYNRISEKKKSEEEQKRIERAAELKLAEESFYSES